MIVHYLKIALRNIFKDKLYSLINLLGLSIAIACCFLLIFWIKFELSYEDCHQNAGRIYKVLKVEQRADGLHKSDCIGPAIANQLKQAFPEIEAATVLSHEQLSFTKLDNKDDESIFTDYTNALPDYLDIFTYEYIEGSKENVLKNRGVVMSEEAAKKFFGKESAIGKTVCFGETKFNVQAVVRIPQNTQIRFDILDPFKSHNNGFHYILVKENAHFSKEKQRLLADFLGTTRETKDKLYFQELKDIHLYSPKELVYNNEWQTYGDLKQIFLFSFVALLILIIAIINYVNTSVARAMSRMREVGVRKVTGSTQKQLILRFLSDAFIISAASIVLAIIVSKSLFPEFSILMGNQTIFYIDFNTILIALAVCLFITLLS